MGTRLLELFGILAVTACLTIMGFASGPAKATDWPGDIGPGQELSQSRISNVASAGPLVFASEMSHVRAFMYDYRPWQVMDHDLAG